MLYFPFLDSIYKIGRPISYVVMRILCGLALMVHGYPKVQDPYGAIDMVEGLGFYPGSFWSPALSYTEFGAGCLLALGLLTRFASAGAFIILIVAAYFHWVPLDQGFSGAEKSILWASICLFYLFHGSGRYSVDGAIGKEL